MKRLILCTSILILSMLACSFGGVADHVPTPTQPFGPASRCGDGVCDESENAQNCPQDCPAAVPKTPTESPSLPTPTQPAPVPQPSGPRGRCGDGVCDGPENVTNCPEDCAQPLAVPTKTPTLAPTPTPTSTPALGQVFVEVQVQRDDGVGDCGSPPWGVDHIDGGDFSCPPPKYWYGYNLIATALQIVQITPADGGTWLIAGAKKGGGTYQEAAHWSDGQRVCSPVSITGQEFEFDVEGTVQDDQIELTLSALPVEVSNWACADGNTYERETTLLLIDWAIAMTGDYTNLSATLDGSRRLGPGVYEREYIADMNPSPQNRDHVTATVEFRCIEPTGEGVYVPVACPWGR